MNWTKLPKGTYTAILNPYQLDVWKVGGRARWCYTIFNFQTRAYVGTGSGDETLEAAQQHALDSARAVAHPSESIRAMLKEAKERHRRIIATMPDKAVTPRQKALQKKHGTPKAFAEVCINAIGDISTDEALEAILKYRDEWAGPVSNGETLLDVLAEDYATVISRTKIEQN